MKHIPALLIAKKRDGHALGADEIEELVAGVVDGSLADSQLAALLMAGLIRGSNVDEVVAWTRAMRDSGRVLSRDVGPSIDKHSTGGVGDKISLVLAPALAACGAYVPMISGRGLGHTGGTIDKLESIPGLTCALDAEAFERHVAAHGFVIAEAGPWLAPADRRIYAVRDVSATVECVPWITASILSKKLAEGLDGLVLDVKCGRGAFMKTPEAARELASSLVDVARSAGVRAAALVTDMDRPLGHAIGNALEVRESLACLRGEASVDSSVRDLTIELGAAALQLVGIADSTEDGAGRIARALDDGSALERFGRFVEAQGGDPRVLDAPESCLPRASARGIVRAEHAGFVQSIDPMELALAGLELGAGRVRPGDLIDPSVGIEVAVAVSSEVQRGDALAHVHASSSAQADEVSARLAAAFRVGDSVPGPRTLVLERSGA